MNKKLTLLGIVLLIVTTLTSCFYYSGHGYYHRDDDRHWQGNDRSHHNPVDHRGDRRPR